MTERMRCVAGVVVALAVMFLGFGGDIRCADCRPQPVPCPPCFVCVQTGVEIGRVPQPECPLPRS